MNWEEIRAEYETTEITLADLADKHGIKYPTIKSRKQRQGWSKDASLPPSVASAEKDASKIEKRRGPPKGSRNAAGHGAPKGNKNAVGNRGGPGGPLKNDHAVTHGFFRKYLPDRTLEIMEQVAELSPIDMLWDQIMLQYTAIIAAQPIMFVENKDEMIKELKKQKFEVHSKGKGDKKQLIPVVIEEEHEFQFSWDRHATFLTAQSRAMAELRSLIKQFIDLANEDDERRLKLEQMQLNIEKTKADVEKANAEAEKLKKGGAGKEPLHIIVDYGDDEEDDAS